MEPVRPVAEPAAGVDREPVARDPFPGFPLLQRELCVLVQLTECRGKGEFSGPDRPGGYRKDRSPDPHQEP